MRAMLLAILIASASGCLVHERPVEDDAAVAPDAFVAHDAARPPVDAFRPDAWAEDAYAAHCDGPRIYPAPIDHFRYVDLTELACSVGTSTCAVFEIAGDGRVDTAGAPCTSFAGDPGQTVRFDRCAADTTRTLVRVTTLESAEHAGIVMSDEHFACVSTTPAPAPGETVEIVGTEAPAEVFDAVTFYGIGARYQVEACAIGPCP